MMNKDISYKRMSVIFYDLKKGDLSHSLNTYLHKLRFILFSYTYVIKYMISIIIASAAPVNKGSFINQCIGKNELNLEIRQEKLFGSIP